MHAVIADAPEPALAAPPGDTEAPAPHNDRAEAEPLDHMSLDNVDLEDDKWLREVLRLGGREGVEVLLQLLRRHLLSRVVEGGGGDGKVDGAPIIAVRTPVGGHGGGRRRRRGGGSSGRPI